DSRGPLPARSGGRGAVRRGDPGIGVRGSACSGFSACWQDSSSVTGTTEPITRLSRSGGETDGRVDELVGVNVLGLETVAEWAALTGEDRPDDIDDPPCPVRVEATDRTVGAVAEDLVCTHRGDRLCRPHGAVRVRIEV